MSLFQDNSANHTSKRMAKHGTQLDANALKSSNDRHGGYNRRVRDVNGNIGEQSYKVSNVPAVTCIQVRPIVGYVGHTVLAWKKEWKQIVRPDGRRENVQVWTGIDHFACYVVSTPVYGVVEVETARPGYNGIGFTRTGDGHGVYLKHGKCTFSGYDRTDVARQRERAKNPQGYANRNAYLATFMPHLSEEKAALRMRQKERRRKLRIAEAKKRQKASALRLVIQAQYQSNMRQNKARKEQQAELAHLRRLGP